MYDVGSEGGDFSEARTLELGFEKMGGSLESGPEKGNSWQSKQCDQRRWDRKCMMCLGHNMCPACGCLEEARLDG